MKYHILPESTHSLATITTAKSETAVVYISANIHGAQINNPNGVTLLYTDLLKSGAGELSRDAFIDALNQLGASISVTITDNVATFSIRSLSTVVEKVLALFTLMMQVPTFSKKELTRAKNTFTNLLQESKEESQAIAQYELRNAFYGNQDRRYTKDENTLIAEVALATSKEIVKLHKIICESTWTCSFAGDNKTIRSITNTIKKIKAQTKHMIPTEGYHQQKPPRSICVFRDIPSRQNIDFSIGVPVPITLHHPDFAALNFALAVLGKWGGFTGRLMSTVRELEGLTYGIYARPEGFYNDEQGYWRIMTFFSPAQAIQGLTSTYREITRFYTDGITEAELLKFKQILTTGQVLLQDSTLSQLKDLHAYHQQGFTLKEITEHKNKLNTLTTEEVNQAIKTYCNPALLTISAAGPINKKMVTELQVFIKSVS